MLLVWLIGRRLLSLYSEVKNRRQQRFLRRKSHFAIKHVTSNELLFVGDSITEGADWHGLFPEQSTHNSVVRNFGIGSDTTAGVLERLAPILAGHPRAIFLLIGTNDIGTGIPLLQTTRNYRAIVAQIHQSTPATQLYIQSILPREASQQAAVEALNRQIQHLAAEYGATYIDLYSQFLGEEGGIDPICSNDELHLLGSGYRRWQQALVEPMKRAAA